jgi:hypothetical protein
VAHEVEQTPTDPQGDDRNQEKDLYDVRLRCRKIFEPVVRLQLLEDQLHHIYLGPRSSSAALFRPVHRSASADGKNRGPWVMTVS